MVAVAIDRLEQSLEALESLLDLDRLDAPAQRNQRYRVVLSELVQALGRHIAVSEGSGGTLTTLESPKQATAATLEHAVHRLRIEHIELLTAARELQMMSKHTWMETDGAEWGAMRQDCVDLLRRLREHHEGERKLLMDTVNTDVGVGD